MHEFDQILCVVLNEDHAIEATEEISWMNQYEQIFVFLI